MARGQIEQTQSFLHFPTIIPVQPVNLVQILLAIAYCLIEGKADIRKIRNDSAGGIHHCIPLKKKATNISLALSSLCPKPLAMMDSFPTTSAWNTIALQSMQASKQFYFSSSRAPKSISFVLRFKFTTAFAPLKEKIILKLPSSIFSTCTICSSYSST